MWYVELKKPLERVRSTLFVFETEQEAFEFQERLDRDRLRTVSELGEVGSPREIFPDWGYWESKTSRA